MEKAERPENVSLKQKNRGGQSTLHDIGIRRALHGT
jgi:hypothetical protein